MFQLKHACAATYMSRTCYGHFVERRLGPGRGRDRMVGNDTLPGSTRRQYIFSIRDCLMANPLILLIFAVAATKQAIGLVYVPYYMWHRLAAPLAAVKSCRQQTLLRWLLCLLLGHDHSMADNAALQPSQRFICPFPGCNRSFRDFWR